jgi:hypothetical protein
MKRSRSTPLATLSTLSPTRTTEPIELLKHMGSPKRTYVGNCINIGPGRRIPKGRKHADVQERKHHGELAFGQVDPEVVAAQLAAKKKRTEQEALDKLPKPLEIYNRRALYPEWLLKDERFDRIFKMPMMPEFVAIRKDPLRRHDDDKTALTKWLGTHSLFTHFSTFKRRALGNITRLHKFTTGDIICSHGATRKYLLSKHAHDTHTTHDTRHTHDTHTTHTRHTHYTHTTHTHKSQLNSMLKLMFPFFNLSFKTFQFFSP